MRPSFNARFGQQNCSFAPTQKKKLKFVYKWDETDYILVCLDPRPYSHLAVIEEQFHCHQGSLVKIRVLNLLNDWSLPSINFEEQNFDGKVSTIREWVWPLNMFLSMESSLESIEACIGSFARPCCLLSSRAYVDSVPAPMQHQSHQGHSGAHSSPNQPKADPIKGCIDGKSGPNPNSIRTSSFSQSKVLHNCWQRIINSISSFDFENKEE